MKKSFFILLLLCLTLSIFGQDNTAKVMVQFDFLKVEESKKGEYLAIEKDWRKVHESLRKDGKILRWMLYEVMLPSGSATEHNYVTVTLYKDYASIENIIPNLANEFRKVFPDKNFNETWFKTNGIRTRIKTEIFMNQDGYWKPNANFQHSYVRADFVKTDPMNAGPYQNLESNFWKPVHKLMTEKNLLQGWQLCSKIYTGTTNPYTHITINLFDNFKQTTPDISVFQTLAKEVHKDLSDKELTDKIMQTLQAREYKASELWKLVDML